MKVIVINGPNMNLLGKREPEVYGYETLGDLEKIVSMEAQRLGIEVSFYQSNHEGELIDTIHKAQDDHTDAIVINPAAFTHYSLAIRDAIKGTGIKAIEVHMSNIYAREEFRNESVIAPVCVGQICGFGFQSYIAALNALKTK